MQSYHDLFDAGKHVPGWMPLGIKESYGNRDQHLRYGVNEPPGGRDKGNRRALFYLHGLGGHPFENEEMASAMSERGYTVFCVEQPGMKIIYSFDPRHPREAVSFFNAFTLKTLLKSIWNGYRVIDQLAEWWGFQKVDVVGLSYGGMTASLFAAHSPRAHRCILVASSLDIPDVVTNFPKLCEDQRFQILAHWTTAWKRAGSEDMKRGRGPYGELWRQISPWRIPCNRDARVTCLSNEGDPVMRADPLKEALRLARESGWTGLNVEFLLPTLPKHKVDLSSVGGPICACERYLF